MRDSRPKALLLPVLAVVLLGACRSPFMGSDSPGKRPSATTRAGSSGVRARPLSPDDPALERSGPPGTQSPGSGAAGPGTAGNIEGSSPAKAAGNSAGAGRATADASPLSPALSDPTGDARLGPGFADLIQIAEFRQGADLRFDIRFAGDLPAQLVEGETMGVSLDFFRPGVPEGAYQLFAEGGQDGWFAYFSAGPGLKAFPGTFQVGGPLIVFTTPESALGGRGPRELRVLSEWSGAGTVPVASEDYAPDSGKHRF